jgi:branched-chain amino acid transport system ATP-binding protein
MLKLTNLRAYYYGIEALHGLDIEVKDGEICCILGANGAGKSTLLKSISGVVKHTGSIMWNDRDLSNANPREVVRQRIVHVPEGRLTFPGLTVYQNLEMGTINWHGFFGHQSYNDDMEKVFELFPRLRERKDQLAWSLSGGEQQMLAIGRGLMARPSLLMLDEPSMGLAPLVIKEVFQKIIEINQKGISILLIEQNANLALKISNYAYIFEQGKITLEGNASDLRNDSRVKEAYLG